MDLCANVFETFEGLSHEGSPEVMPKVVEPHAHQFLLCELLRTPKGEISTSIVKGKEKRKKNKKE